PVKGLPGTGDALLKEVLRVLPCEDERVVVQRIEVLIDRILELGPAVHDSPPRGSPSPTSTTYAAAAYSLNGGAARAGGYRWDSRSGGLGPACAPPKHVGVAALRAAALPPQSNSWGLGGGRRGPLRLY